jgi:hypothetical protein
VSAIGNDPVIIPGVSSMIGVFRTLIVRALMRDWIENHGTFGSIFQQDGSLVHASHTAVDCLEESVDVIVDCGSKPQRVPRVGNHSEVAHVRSQSRQELPVSHQSNAMEKVTTAGC